MVIPRTKTGWAVSAVIAVGVILLFVAITHKSYEQAVKELLSDFETECHNAIREEYPSELPIDSFWDNEELRDRLINISEQSAERLAALGEGAVEEIASHARENAILYVHLSAWHHGQPSLESIRAEIVRSDYSLNFLDDPWEAIVNEGRLFVCFIALEKIGKPASNTLESMLPGEWTGFPAAVVLAGIKEKEILQKHFEVGRASQAERLNSATGLAFLKDKTVLPFLIRALGESDSLKLFQVELAILSLGKAAVPEVRKAYEEGRIPRSSFPVLGLLRNAGVDYSKHLHVSRFHEEEDEAPLNAQKPLGGLCFRADEIPEEKLGSFLRDTMKDYDKGVCVRVEAGAKVAYSHFEKFLNLCEKNGVYAISLQLATLGLPDFSNPSRIRLYDESEQPALTLQMLVFKLRKKKIDGNSAVAYLRDSEFEFIIPRELPRPPQWGKLYTLLVNAFLNYRPTKSFKQLPVVVEPSPNMTMAGVTEFLSICHDANVTDVSFVHHTRFCDWVEEAERIKKEQDTEDE